MRILLFVGKTYYYAYFIFDDNVSSSLGFYRNYILISSFIIDVKKSVVTSMSSVDDNSDSHGTWDKFSFKSFKLDSLY